MENLQILLPVEISSRELHSKILLAYNLAKKGCDVYLGDKKSILDFAKYVPGSVYFDKGYHRGISEDIYDKLEFYNIRIVSLDEENAVDFADFQQLNLRFPDEILKKFRYIFLWGIRQYKYLSDNRKNFDKNKIFVTGHPRFDLLKDNFYALYSKKIENIKSRFDKFILINTNFGLGNNIKPKDSVIQNYGSRFPQIESLINYQESQVKIFIRLCKDLAQFNDFNIILRPHPEENIDTYKGEFKDFDNIHALSEGSVLPWIMASDLMIHHDCTTAIECAMIGKNSIAYIKDLNTELTTDIPLKISYQYDDISKIKEHIRDMESRELKINNSILHDYFNFNQSSLNKIISHVMHIERTADRPKNYFLYKHLARIKMKINRLTNRIDYLYENKINGMNYENITSIVSKYKSMSNKKENISVDEIHKRLYKVNLDE